jgi:YVTN family beta-propeller protein
LYLVRNEAKGTSQPRSHRSFFLSRIRPVATLAMATLALASLSGCGNTYRPVVAAVNPVGPAAQPTKYAVAISSPSESTNGLVTFVDFAGDSILITASLGVGPYYLALNSGGTTGYSLNNDGSLNSFDISPSLLSSQVLQTTLLSCNQPSGVTCVQPNSIFADTASTYITEPNRNSVAQLQGSPAALKQEFPIATGYTPIYIAGFAGSPRAYIINQSTTGGAGQVAAIEAASSSVSTTIPVGKQPVYGVMTSNGKRAFILNQADGTVSVVNAQTNAVDTPPAGSTNPIVVGTSPVWADLAPTLNELFVANAGDGTHPGSLSIINIPLCSVSAIPSNPNCDENNPVDAVGFGQVLATVPVGVNPVMVAVLQDGSQAYVLNKNDSTVSVVNLTFNTVTATIPVPASPNPTFIAVTTGTPTGKVYVTSPNSNTMTIIRTDTNTVDTTVDLQGRGMMVRVTAP